MGFMATISNKSIRLWDNLSGLIWTVKWTRRFSESNKKCIVLLNVWRSFSFLCFVGSCARRQEDTFSWCFIEPLTIDGYVPILDTLSEFCLLECLGCECERQRMWKERAGTGFFRLIEKFSFNTVKALLLGFKHTILWHFSFIYSDINFIYTMCHFLNCIFEENIANVQINITAVFLIALRYDFYVDWY